MMINSRTKGHQFEVVIALQLRDLGYQCVTARSESKSLDDQGVDLVDNTPFHIQLKRVERLIRLNEVLARMPRESPAGIPKIPVVVHKKNHKPTLVTMSWEDFKDICL